MAQFGIADLSDNQPQIGVSREGIDWSKSQPFGTWRCDRGYETEGYQCLCLERATTTVHSEDTVTGRMREENLCTDHALIHQLHAIESAITEQVDDARVDIASTLERQTEASNNNTDRLMTTLDELTDNVWAVNETLQTMAWYCQPLWRRMWLTAVRGVRWVRDWLHYRRRYQWMSLEEIQREADAQAAVRAWLKRSTPNNAYRVTRALEYYAQQADAELADGMTVGDWADVFDPMDDAQAYIEGHDR
jgi:hypothetical protein